MSDHSKQPEPTDGGERELSSEDLAALIIDALLRAGIVQAVDVKRAIAITAEEIDVRKILGDYPISRTPLRKSRDVP